VALGLVHPRHVKRNADAQPGDLLVLGKPLGVGVMSAALKKGELGDAGYAQMIATTTKLNTPGPDLAALPGVHALTDVSGFGLGGHALEMARGARCDVQIDWPAVPLMAGVRNLASQGFVTGASGRNCAGYGADVVLPHRYGEQDAVVVGGQWSLIFNADVHAGNSAARLQDQTFFSGHAAIRFTARYALRFALHPGAVLVGRLNQFANLDGFLIEEYEL